MDHSLDPTPFLLSPRLNASSTTIQRASRPSIAPLGVCTLVIEGPGGGPGGDHWTQPNPQHTNRQHANPCQPRQHPNEHLPSSSNMRNMRLTPWMPLTPRAMQVARSFSRGSLVVCSVCLAFCTISFTCRCVAAMLAGSSSVLSQ